MAEVDAVDNVAPLVGAAHLQPAADTLVELDEVIGLQDHVVEFEERQRLLAVEPESHGIESEHAVDGEMPADIAQEIDVVDLHQPVGVVDHDRVAGAAAEFEIGREIAPDADEIVVDILWCQQLARFVLEGGVTDHRGAAPHQRDRPVAGLLQPVEHHDLDQRSRMQALRRRVEADIGAHRFLGEKLIEAGFIRNLMNEAALAHDAQEIGLEGGHFFFPEIAWRSAKRDVKGRV